MKRTLSIMLFFLAMQPTFLFGSQKEPLFFLTYYIDGDSIGKKEAEGVPGLFFATFTNLLKNEFPCARHNSVDAVRELLGFNKQQQLLGTPGSEGTLKSVAGAMGSDYLVILDIKCFYQANTISFSAHCTEIASGKKLVMVQSGSSLYGDWADAMIAMTEKMVEGFKAYEICAFKGPLSVEVLTDSTDKKTEEYGVYCSKMDRNYKKTVTHEKKSSADWKLEKVGKSNGSGTVVYSMAEKHTIDELNECYTCESMVTGSRHYTDNTVSFAEIRGIGDRPQNEGDYVKYATIRLNFLDNDTYTIQVDAASKPGELKTIREEKATGECQTFDKPQEQRTNKTDIGLHEILGPYDGNSLYKVLQEEETIERVDPVTKERTTIKISFNLKRD